MSLAEAFHFACIPKHDLEGMLLRRVPIEMFTDSRSVFDVLTKNSTTIENRIVVNIATARQI